MSKLLNDRELGKYDVLLASKELAGYTIKLTQNEKNFPKRYRLSVTNKIQDKAIEIVDCLIMAQEIFPNTRLEYQQRQLYQKQARAACRSMMALIEIAADTFGVRAGTFQYWTKEATELRNHLTAWIMSDQQRFQNLK